MTDATPMLGRPSVMWGRMPYPYPGENLGTGNRCGHNPNRPEFHLFRDPDWMAGIPHTIRKLMEAAKLYYDAPLATLPSLANLNGRRNKSGDPRKNRSEARAAEVLVMRAILLMTEFASLRVGVPKPDGGFIPRSCTELAAVAGLLKKKAAPEEDDEPSPRFWRAFRRLRKAGAIDVHLQYEEKPDGSKRARPAIKRVNPHFLIALGAVSCEALERFRTYCSNQLKKLRRGYRAEHPTKSDAAAARDSLRRSQGENGVQTFALGNRRQAARLKATGRDVYQAELLAYQADLAKRQPDLSARDIARRVMREFPTFTEWERSRQDE